MGKGTEAFPTLGEHCSHEECNQLDFLPFTCDGCHRVFCLEHRTYKQHSCPNSQHNSRMVIVCEICSTSLEKKPDERSDDILNRHEMSGYCDPKKKQKQKCPVKHCKQLLTFSNTSICKSCSLKVCLKHRFPSDHACMPSSTPAKKSSEHQPLHLAPRKGVRCAATNQNIGTSPRLKAY